MADQAASTIDEPENCTTRKNDTDTSTHDQLPQQQDKVATCNGSGLLLDLNFPFPTLGAKQEFTDSTSLRTPEPDSEQAAGSLIENEEGNDTHQGSSSFTYGMLRPCAFSFRKDPFIKIDETNEAYKIDVHEVQDMSEAVVEVKGTNMVHIRFRLSSHVVELKKKGEVGSHNSHLS